jgi:hypothetical protein
MTTRRGGGCCRPPSASLLLLQQQQQQQHHVPMMMTMIRFAQTVPRYGTPEQMQEDAIEQIRARVKYQKDILDHHLHSGGHHSPAANLAEMWRWVNISLYIAVPISILSVIYSFVFDVHPHRADGELPEYMVVRSKEYPWECSNCDLFDYPCWKQCKAEKKK